jgi:hypothetical protein
MTEQSKTCGERGRTIDNRKGFAECAGESGQGDSVRGEAVMDFGLTSSNKFGRELLKSHLTSTIVEANLELVEHSRAAEEVETNAKALRKTHGSGNLTGAELNRNVMNEGWNIAAVANHDHLPPAALPVDPHISGLSPLTMLKVAPEST